MTRAELILQLRVKFGAATDNKLLDTLQERALVSCNSVTLDECADRDLIAALQRDERD